MTHMRFDVSGYLATLESIGLRPKLSDDCVELYRIYSDPDVMRYLGGAVAEPESSWVEKCRSNRDVSNFSLVQLATGRYVGNVRLCNVIAESGVCYEPGRLELFILLAKPFVGDSLGQSACRLACAHAFGPLGTTRVTVTAHPRHPASHKLVEQFGFLCATDRIEPYGDGRTPVTCPTYTLSVDHWRARHPADRRGG